jgi:hypothetical protein
MDIGLTVHMNGRDVTPWLVEASIEQPRRTLYRQAELVFHGWTALEDGAAWRVFATYDTTEPYAETLLDAGVAPPDRVRRLRVASGEQPRLAVTVYDHVWLAQRRGPSETLVLVPDTGGESVATAIAKHAGPVGAYKVHGGVRTLHDAVRLLARLAGFRVRVLLPDAPLAPLVLDPSASYWTTLVELLTPWRPRTHYDRHNNTLVFSDPLGAGYNTGRTLLLPAAGVHSVTGWPVKLARTRRVIVRLNVGA